MTPDEMVRLIEKYGLQIEPHLDDLERAVESYSIFSEIEGGFWGDGFPLSAAIQNWMDKNSYMNGTKVPQIGGAPLDG